MATEETASRPEGPVIRRSELRRKLGPERVWHRSPAAIQSTAVAVIFAILAWVVCDWSRHQNRWVEGQVITGAILNRVDYQLENETLTRQQRDLARRNAPRIYEINRSYLEAIRAAIEGLPQAVAGKTSLAEVDGDLVRTFSLEPRWLPLLQAHQDARGPTDAWRLSTERFVLAISSGSPLVTREEFQKFATAARREVIVPAPTSREPASGAGAAPGAGHAQAPGPASAALPGGAPAPSRSVDPGPAPVAASPTVASEPAPSASAPEVATSLATDAIQRTQPIGRAAIEIPDDDPTSVRTRLVTEAMLAGFGAELAPIVANAVLHDLQPTIRCNEVATQARAEAEASAVRSVLESHPRGEVIAMPGDSITRDRLGHLAEEQAQAMARTPALDRWSASVGLLGTCVLLAAALAVALAILRPSLLADATRLSLLLGGLLILLVATAFLTASFPRLTVLVSMSVVVLAASSLALLYDRRTAIVAATAEAALLALALDETVGFVLATLLTAGAYAWLLRDVRHRSALVRATSIAALIAGAAVASVALMDTPLGGGGAVQLISAACLAAVGVLVTGFLLVGVLPSLERAFGVVTGLTLAELRDPRQPLLRQLQQKAPGTWTHSQQVANIAEAAAESIGADGLLAYVGALYHDIGKMHKPEYFVENQTEGYNRHDAITPAMSLLVILGHVKDGVELAAEYRLPRAVRHMIESHHGTTMVEYFFHLAQRRAERTGDEAGEIEEHAWRYPGPRPQTREAAILLLCDGSESAARTLADPTPARIEQLVHSISRRRLEDGQFDDSPITFRELRAVEESICKSLCSLYHGRIIYPSTARTASEHENGAPAHGVDAEDADDPRSPGRQPTPGPRRAVA